MPAAFLSVMLELLSHAVARPVVQAAALGQWMDLGRIPVGGDWGSLLRFVGGIAKGWIQRTAWLRIWETPGGEAPPTASPPEKPPQGDSRVMALGLG